MSVKRSRGAPSTAVADLSDTVATKWRGYIDRHDPETGIHGWALMADAPLDRISLELVVGETVFHRVDTSVARTDIDAVLGVRVTPGFHFPAAVFARLAYLNARRRELPVRVRFAASNVFLVGRDPDPTVGQLVDAWCSLVLNSFAHPRAEMTSGERLLSRLTALRTEAVQRLDLPLHPTSDLDAGQIEKFHVGSSGQLWFSGWMRRDTDTEFFAVIVDRQKYPSAGATLHYERQDLASGYVGVVGVLDTEWSASAISKDFFLYMGAQAALQIRATPSTQLIGSDAFLSVCREAQTSLVGGNAEALASVLTSGNAWMPGNGAVVGIAVEAAVDRLFLIPGFGCLVEGWALCPTKQIRTFEMKLGATVLQADDTSIYFRPRPDVAGIFKSESLVSRAGFVAVFRGDAPLSVTGTPLLRILFTDGSVSTHALDGRSLHRLDYLADSGEVLRLFPSLRQEAFYSALLGAVRRQLREIGRDVLALAVNPMHRVIIIRLPAGASNQRLCFDLAARMATTAEAGGVGCCFITEQTEELTQAKLLFDELRGATSMPLSLFCLQRQAQGFAALPVVLAHALADRFVYVDGGALLTEAGWTHAVGVLTRSGHAIHYFEFIDDTGAPDRVNGAISAACFGWTTAAFFSWLPESVPFLRGVCSTNALPPTTSARHVLPASAIRIERESPSRLADLIDGDLLAERLKSVET